MRPRQTWAQEMESQNFRIQGGNFNMTSGSKNSQNYKLSDVVGQTAAGLFASKGFLINAGFINVPLSVFAFSVSPTVVDFRELFPNVPVEKILQLTVSNGDSAGYTVTVAENQPLSTSAGAEIPDTACEPEKICTTAQASSWNKNTSYGFGYHLMGRTIPTDFQNENFYRSFPATRRGETPSLVMQSQAKKVTDTAVMTLRLVIGPNQPVGRYKNVLSFTALAGI